MARTQPDRRGSGGKLDPQLVIDCAARLVRRHGVGKLSMRALARELGVSPMAIYNHIPNKDALLAQLEAAVPALVSGKPKRRKAASPLSEQQIVTVALKLLRSLGVEQLSMRGLARELGVSVMALYHHVPGKEQLMDKLRDALLARVPIPPVTGASWEAQMRAYALEGVLLLSEYPGLLSFGVLRPPTASDRRLARHGIEVLLAAGCDARTAALAITTYHTHIFGLLLTQSDAVRKRLAKYTGRDRPEPRADIAAVARELRELSFREAIEFGIDTVLLGLRVQIAAARAKPTGSASVRSLAAAGRVAQRR